MQRKELPGWNPFATFSAPPLVCRTLNYNGIQPSASPSETVAARAAPAPGSPLARLLRWGPKALADGELLALVLAGGGRAAASVLAARLLAECGGLGRLAALHPGALVRLGGVGWARAARLLAACELGRRCGGPPRSVGLLVRGPTDLVPMLEEEFRGCDREHFLAVLLDTRHRVTAVETVAIGCLDASLVHPREVYRTAVALGAAAVVAAHNHPSGCARPSLEDIGLTRRLARCGRLIGIELLDHLVIGHGEYTSLREHGWPVAGGDGADGKASDAEGWRP
jgi:DNA repair protein RadC